MPQKSKKRGGTSHENIIVQKFEVKPNVVEMPKALFNKVLSTGSTELDLHTMVVSYDASVSTDGSGNWATVFTNNPTGYGNWTNLAATYDEYRVLGIKVMFEPNRFVGGSSVLVLAPIATVVDYDSTTNLASYVIATEYSSFLEFQGNSRWTRVALMSGIENAGFQNAASPTATFAVKVFSSGNTASTVLGRVSLRSVIQFRGKGI